MSVNIPEQKKKDGMFDTLSTVASIGANIYSMSGKGDGKTPEDPRAAAMKRRQERLAYDAGNKTE